MSTKTNEHFSEDTIWYDYDSSGSITEKKIPWVLQNIPEDTSSILDIGCGNGIITNELSKSFKTTGADMSDAALKQVNCPTINCSSESIPVESESFDMVFSSQLLEHLNNEQLEASVKEFKRIASRYILITVPHKEFLKFCETKCPKCNAVFNTNGHYQSFDLLRIKELFSDDFELIKHSLGGSLHQQYNPFLMDIRQNLGNRYYNPVKYTMCPNCKNDDFPLVKGNLISKICNGLNRIVSPRANYWILTLFERRNHDNT
ncbi:class I SAM-dependent methyltransferase [Carboxylicivirga sp. M1479]|uniref:class I SAM-dependent methyltransferase n=1 Tax=Carboxylicivirga sp. M1479 TaxID=2594476 RepID=UPI001177F6E9|nr:class I SAM-dependent methyltransferase [Carboxylicivirga sp. M1479]TRX71723.1 methyltransferase domain-containing protein [Carboxylicivirga sp. M1479]